MIPRNVVGTTLPAGEYYIGDPCYVIEEWPAFLDVFEVAEDNDEDVFEYKGRNVFVHHTMHGDGLYDGSDGHEYGVDSGLIGVVPIGLVTKNGDGGLGMRYKFDTPFTVAHSNGTFYIDTLVINTDPDPYSDQEGEDDEVEEGMGWDGDESD